jgi:putative flippase GtrA
MEMIFDRKFFRFILVGIINTLVGSAIMFLLYNIVHFNYWFSSACNYIFTSVLSFFLNKYFTFGIRQWYISMIIAFILTIVLSYLIAYGISKPVMEYFLRNTTVKIRENTALFSGMCLFTLINYIGQRLVVFKHKNGVKNA